MIFTQGCAGLFIFELQLFPEVDLTKALFGELKALHGDKGVWKLLEAHPEWVREIEIDRPFPGDINTLEDYARLTSVSAS